MAWIWFQGIQESLYKDETVKSLDDFYDPCFLLPLFSELTRPGKVSVSLWYLVSGCSTAGAAPGALLSLIQELILQGIWA